MKEEKMLTEPAQGRIPEIDVDRLVLDTEDNFRIHGHVYTDREVFEAEMHKIFGTTWVYVAHESEIAHTGDYKTAYIGLQPVIVSRSEDGGVHVLLNRCRHRAAVVCRERKGNANYFRCPYHGWVYGNNGKLTGIAQRRGGYAEDFDKPEGLVRVPRVESYRGLIFASLNPEVPSLSDYLGEAKLWIDRQFDRSPVGEIELRYEPHVTEYQGNWKFQAENTVDGYHGDVVHESFWMIQEKFGLKSGQHGAYVQSSVRDIKKMRKQGRTMGFKQGHGLWNTPFDPAALDQKLQGEHGEYYRTLVEKHGRDEVVNMLSNINVMVFPNVGVLHGQIRVVRPISVDRTEVSIYPFALKGVPESINEERLRGYERFFGPSSFGSPDDVEIFALNQQGLQAEQVDWLILERGLRREKVTETGDRVGHVTDETPQRALHRRWKQTMSQ
jgi:benzoate/toluate 1,2-dioxygenase alpha subunit